MKNSTKNLYDLPNEILTKIFTQVDNRRNLLKVCKRFYDLVNFIDVNNLKLEVKSEYLLNENFNFEKLLEHTNFITLYSNYFSLPNFDEKFSIFLEKYGHKIIDFTHYYPTTFNITKFLHFMPNLQILNLQGSTIPIEVLNGWKRNSFPLKKLYVESAFQSQWEYLEIFDIEELNLHGYSRMDEKLLDLIPNWLNLKRVRVTASHSGLDKLLIALRKKNLEVLQYIVYNIEDDELIKFFNTQKNLKSLKISQYKSSLLTNISEIFTNQLESLEIWSAEKKLDREDFMKISNIKSLQSLAIRDYKLKDELLLALATFSLPNLKSLLLQFDISISQEILDVLAENFKQIQTLEFDVDREFYHEILPKVFKSFNFVKNLIVTYRFNQFDDEIHKDEIDENFYFSDHKNLNLKSLKFKICCYDHKKLVQKIKKDFPNLELTIDEEILKFSRKITDFPSFCVNLHAIENGNKLLEDSEILFDTRFVENNTATALKNGKREITFNIDRYFAEQELKTILTIPRKLTSLTLRLKKMFNQQAIDFYINYIKKINQQVKSLIIKNRATLEQLKQVIEAFPNLENLELKDFNPIPSNSEIVELKSMKIKNFTITYEMSHKNDMTKKMKKSQIFFDQFRFPKNNLENFKINFTSDYGFVGNFDLEIIEKFLENQNQLEIVRNEPDSIRNRREHFFEMKKI